MEPAIRERKRRRLASDKATPSSLNCSCSSVGEFPLRSASFFQYSLGVPEVSDPIGTKSCGAALLIGDTLNNW